MSDALKQATEAICEILTGQKVCKDEGLWLCPMNPDEANRMCANMAKAALAARSSLPETDLIERLNAYAAKFGPLDPERAMCLEAVGEIERMTATFKAIRDEAAVPAYIRFIANNAINPQLDVDLEQVSKP